MIVVVQNGKGLIECWKGLDEIKMSYSGWKIVKNCQNKSSYLIILCILKPFLCSASHSLINLRKFIATIMYLKKDYSTQETWLKHYAWGSRSMLIWIYLLTFFTQNSITELGSRACPSNNISASVMTMIHFLWILLTRLSISVQLKQSNSGGKAEKHISPWSILMFIVLGLFFIISTLQGQAPVE